MFIPGFFNLVKIGFGKESLVGEQGLIDRSQLVDAKLGIGNTAPPVVPAPSGAGKGHQLDDLLHDNIAETYPVQDRGLPGIKEMAAEWRNTESVVIGIAEHVQLPGRVLRLKPVIEQVKEKFYGCMDKIAVF